METEEHRRGRRPATVSPLSLPLPRFPRDTDTNRPLTPPLVLVQALVVVVVVVVGAVMVVVVKMLSRALGQDRLRV